MNTLTRTIAVLATLNLLISGLALAQDVSEEELRDALADEAKEADVALAKADSMLTPVPPVLPSGRYSISSRSRWPFRSSGVGSVLVIPSAEIETRDLLTINEDINVMSRIFVTNLQRVHISPSGGNIFVNDNTSALLNVLSGRNRTSIQSLYLQGYGVVFLMKVDFPLSPPHQAQQQDEAKQKEEGDKVWEDMRRQLYEPDQVAKRKTDNPAAKYDAEKVENLKKTVIDALKHAANIRNLKPDESVVVTITGSSASAGNITSMITKTGQVMIYDKDRRITRLVKEPHPSDLGLSAPAVLIIRVKKSDIDGLAGGDFDLDQFRQRVQMLSYPLLGGTGGSEDALDFYHRSVPTF